MTSQKIYAVLRRAGYTAAKPSRGDWQPGVRVEKDSDTYKLWFNVTYKVYGGHGEDRIRNVMQSYIVPALKAAGIEGQLGNDGSVYRVEENTTRGGTQGA